MRTRGTPRRPLVLGGLLTALIAGLIGVRAEADAYYHHTSKIAYQDYSQEAFERARREGRPVFMLITAAWCYWCKYFKQHALETEEVADYLNRHYVSVFVDSDRRMDLTRRYVRGWPMTVLFDTDGRVRQSFPGALRQKDFLWVLKRVRQEIAEGAGQRSLAGKAQAETAPGGMPVNEETYRRIMDGLAAYLDEHFDGTYGGFGTREKYPNGLLLAFLLERHGRSGDRDVVLKTLDGILKGLYDPVEGGFFRYAEHRQWRTPHYEKMAHVNASLLAPYLKAHALTQKAEYRQAAERTIFYLLKTLHDRSDGGFYGSQTADHGYYRLNRTERGRVVRPAINRHKYAAWNAEVAVGLLAAAELAHRQDLKAAAVGVLDFMRQRLMTGRGLYHFYDVDAASGQLSGQLHANAWAAHAFIRGYGVSGQDVYRRAAYQLLDYALAELWDAGRGGFIEWNNPDDRLLRKEEQRSAAIPLDANGIMAGVLLAAHQAGGRARYSEVAERVLTSLGGRVVALLRDDAASDGTAVAELVPYLRAYEAFLARDEPRATVQGRGTTRKLPR